MTTSRRPNRALISARESAGYSQRQLAAHAREAGVRLGLAAPELDAICKQIYRLESGATARPGEDFYRPALAAALHRPAVELFGSDAVTASDRSAGWNVRTRKFIPMYIGAECARMLMADSRLEPATCEWMTTRSLQLPFGESAHVTFTVFDFGVLLAEIIETPRFGSIAEFAVWRKTTYRTAREAVAAEVALLFPGAVCAPAYVLSIHRLAQPYWDGPDLHTAMRLLCAPSVLLEHHHGAATDEVVAAAENAEKAAFRRGFTRPDITSFGIDGVSVGYASWAGVSYLSLSDGRAIPDEVVAGFESVVQALWCYTNHLAEQVEAGVDPDVPDAFGYRFLRACHSRLATARPRESGQERMMRDAILSTSRVTAQLMDGCSTLRDLNLVGRR